MPNNLITKEALANALKELLKEKPLSKISVKCITNYCNISRNTFYYHFADKYELINWIFNSEMLDNVNCFNDPSKLVDSFVNVCKCLYTNRKFYLACFQYVGQNSLYECLYDFYNKLWTINIDMHYTESGVKLTESELDLLAKLKTHALVGILSDWVRDGMNDNYMTYFEQLKSVLDLGIFEYAGISKNPMLNTNSEQSEHNNITRKCKVS